VIAYLYTKFDWYVNINNLRYREIKAARCATSTMTRRYNSFAATTGTWRQRYANRTDANRYSHLKRPANIAGASTNRDAITRAIVMLKLMFMPTTLTGLPRS